MAWSTFKVLKKISLCLSVLEHQAFRN